MLTRIGEEIAVGDALHHQTRVALVAAVAGMVDLGVIGVPGIGFRIRNRLRTATTPIRGAVVTVFVSAVLERPSAFPETVRAIEDALDDDSPRVRRFAASAVSLIAEADAAAVSSIEEVHARVTEIEASVNDGLLRPNEDLSRALSRLDGLVDDGPETA